MIRKTVVYFCRRDERIVFRIGAGTVVVVERLCIRQIRRRHQCHQLLRNRADAVSGNLVARKQVADEAACSVRALRARIEDRDHIARGIRELAEIARTERHGWNGEEVPCAQASLVEQLLPEKEEGLVRSAVNLRNLDGCAEREAALVLMQNRTLTREKAASIQLVVREVVEHAAVELV